MRFRCSRWLAVAVVVGLGLVASLGVYGWLLADLPALDDLHGYAAAPSSKILDREGRLLFEMQPPHTGRHSPVPLAEVPLALRQAVVATEDARFYENPGVDGWAILRAVWINVQGGEILSGGSTITQQLARNLLMSPDERYERTLRRKLREAVLAWRIARRYSKDQILELYLNEIYFGNMAYGVQAAAQAYFDKDVKDLDLAECALLAGLPQAPSYYNPLENLKEAEERQAVVLGLMVKQGYLSQEESDQAEAEKLYFASAPLEIRAPHFVMYVRGQLEERLGLERLQQGGLVVHTTLDLDLNETARDLIRYRLARLAECNGERANCPPGGHNVRNGALVALDPASGEILAMVGSPDYFSARIDGAVNGTTALRQPGSSLKPITYAAAFQQGELTPASMMLDVRTSFVTREGRPYVPLNYDLQFRGPVRLREALASSYNLVAVKVLEATGVEAMTDLARQMGISTLDDVERLGLSVTLGGGEVRLLELTAAYAALANGGYARQTVAIRRVEDAEGTVLLENSLPAAKEGRILDERVAFLVSDILADDQARSPSFGEMSVLALSRPAAAKTGTTTDFRDNWTVGFTPQVVAGVWTGNADNEPMFEISGISGAAPIWHDFMEVALRGLAVEEFERPEGLVEVEVCALSGHLPGPDCPHRVKELLLEGTEPTETCSLHKRIAVDRRTGLQTTEDTPAEHVVEKVYVVLPPEAQEWARERGLPKPPPAGSAGEMGFERVALAGPGEEAALWLSSPDEGARYELDGTLPRVAQKIEIAVGAEPAADWDEVTLVMDGQPLARFDGPPYRVLWQLEPGRHVFWAEGKKSGGITMVSERIGIEVWE